MNVREAYEKWSATYDNDHNRTRDLDAEVTRQTLTNARFTYILELGCGTGKNTAFLAQIGERVLALDFSDAMLARAKEKVVTPNVSFVRCDLTQPWPVPTDSVDLVVGNLVLEHINDLVFVFSEARRCLNKKGQFFISELHPFRQYLGAGAHFENAAGQVALPTFIHHLSDFLNAADATEFGLRQLNEWWHEDDKEMPPRLVSFLFQQAA